MARNKRNYRKLAADSKKTATPRRILPYTLKSISRARQDIASWNRALNRAQNAEDPQSWELQLLYNEIMNDAHLTSQIENRINQVFSSDFAILNSKGEVDDDETNFVKKSSFYRTISRNALEANLVGDNIVELNLIKDPTGRNSVSIDSIPRTNFVSRSGKFYPDFTDPMKFIEYRKLAEYGTWLLEFDSKNLGLLNKAIPHVLFKRFAQSCWSELCEIYGIPPRVLKTNTQDPSMLKRGDQMMRDMGAAAYFIIDETESFEFAKGVDTNGDVYANLINMCNNELSLLISGAVIGQDTKFGSRNKDESSQEVLWLLVQADMQLLETYWNNTVIPAFVKLGILKKGSTFEFQQAEDVDQLFKFTTGLLKYYKVPVDWIKDKFGVEVEEKASDPESTDPEDPKEKEEEKLSFFGKAPEEVTGAKNCCSNHLTLSLPSNSFNQDDQIKRFWNANGSLSFDDQSFLNTANVLIEGFKKGWKEDAAKLAVGFQYGKDDPALLTAYEMNLFRFSAAKTLAEAQELNRLFRQSKSFEEFYQNASLKLDILNKTWLESEYNTAMLVGSSAATYNRLIGNAKTFPYWEYRTVGDDAVRPEHAKLHGLILAYNDPRWNKLFPPNGWNCRCYIVAKMRHEVEGIDFAIMRQRADHYLESSEYKKEAAQGWGVNRGKTAEVFSANQFYVAKFPGAAAKKINSLGPSDYGLPAYSKAKKQAKGKVKVFDGKKDKYFDSLEDHEGTKVIRDYKNRPLEMSPATFDSHTTGSKEERVKYLDAMQETLNNPDEVWIKGDVLEDMVYIKYYEDEAIVVSAKIKNGKAAKISTWFPLAEIKRALVRWRKGLNILGKK